MKIKPKPVVMVCSNCGNDELFINCTACWDVEAQDWLMEPVIETDETRCNVCDSFGKADEIQVGKWPNRLRRKLAERVKP